MGADFTATARRVGLYSSIATALLMVAYAATLAVGLLSLESPDEPIGDPLFSILEVLIIALMPAMVATMAAVHAWAPESRKTLSLVALVFMGLLAGVTCSVHFVMLTVSRQAALAGQPWFGALFEFRWPSVVYALDILGWDVFFPLSVLFAASVFSGSRLAACIRWSMVVSGALAFAGLAGVALGDMQIRNIGIVGYVGVFLVADVPLAFLFGRARPVDSQRPAAK